MSNGILVRGAKQRMSRRCPLADWRPRRRKKIRVEMENIFLAGKCSVRPLKEVPREIKMSERRFTGKTYLFFIFLF